MRLILLRHGETLWNSEQRLQGHSNSPLSERGIRQAQAIKPLIAQLAPTKVVASDLGRTLHTAEIIGFADAIPDANLRELNMGDWTGKRKADIIAEDPSLYQAWRDGNYTPENGETWQQFCQRVGDALRFWATQTNDTLLAVVHSGVIRAACEALLNLPTQHLLPVTQGTVTIFNLEADKPAKLEAYNLGSFSPDLDVAD